MVDGESGCKVFPWVDGWVVVGTMMSWLESRGYGFLRTVESVYIEFEPGSLRMT